ncbi:MAG: isoprenoid biosynthesis glyoxalase ElbB [Bacteroidales bacterium]|nr:isoprenoid biosynthesis glyoxalase ElbB [Bacteroidales bacterium]
MGSKKKFAIILSGNGVYDGAEIHEATMSMHAIVKNGSTYDIFAPDMEQYHVVNHITGEEMNEKRNVMIEAARIARGKISPVTDYNPANYDGLLFPGGFGVAKNLCTFAFDGANCKVLPEIEKTIKDTVAAKKPIGALCISPVLIARVLGDVEITIGQDKTTAEQAEEMGARHINTHHGDVVVDSKFKVATTPCYMLDATIMDIAEDAENVVLSMLEMM